MSFLINGKVKITDYGKQLLAQKEGILNISCFKVFDDSIDYSLYKNIDVTGTLNYDNNIMDMPLIGSYNIPQEQLLDFNKYSLFKSYQDYVDYNTNPDSYLDIWALWTFSGSADPVIFEGFRNNVNFNYSDYPDEYFIGETSAENYIPTNNLDLKYFLLKNIFRNDFLNCHIMNLKYGLEQYSYEYSGPYNTSLKIAQQDIIPFTISLTRNNFSNFTLEFSAKNISSIFTLSQFADLFSIEGLGDATVNATSVVINYPTLIYGSGVGFQEIEESINLESIYNDDGSEFKNYKIIKINTEIYVYINNILIYQNTVIGNNKNVLSLSLMPQNGGAFYVDQICLMGNTNLNEILDREYYGNNIPEEDEYIIGEFKFENNINNEYSKATFIQDSLENEIIYDNVNYNSGSYSLRFDNVNYHNGGF